MSPLLARLSERERLMINLRFVAGLVADSDRDAYRGYSDAGVAHVGSQPRPASGVVRARETIGGGRSGQVSTSEVAISPASGPQARAEFPAMAGAKRGPRRS